MKKWKAPSVLIVWLSVLMLSAMGCSDSGAVEIVTPEAFQIEIMEQGSSGLYEVQGFKKVNSITTIKETKRELHTEILAVEDIYDLEGNYIKTEVSQTTSSSNKNKILPYDGGSSRSEKKVLHSPSTKLLSEQEQDGIINLTEEEEKELEQHVRKLIDDNL